MKAIGQSETFFGNGDQHISADRDPDLRLDRVLGSTKKCLDPQVLLDPFEEQLDLPSALIQRADFRWIQIELIAQEDQGFVGFWIFESDLSEVIGIGRGGFASIQSDGLIADQTGGAVHRPRVNPMGIQIRFRAGHKETAGTMQGVEP